jgi:hypothetical protein
LGAGDSSCCKCVFLSGLLMVIDGLQHRL